MFDLNLFAFKFKLHVQNLFKFKTNSYLNFLNLFNPSFWFPWKPNTRETGIPSHSLF